MELHTRNTRNHRIQPASHRNHHHHHNTQPQRPRPTPSTGRHGRRVAFTRNTHHQQRMDAKSIHRRNQRAITGTQPSARHRHVQDCTVRWAVASSSVDAEVHSDDGGFGKHAGYAVRPACGSGLPQDDSADIESDGLAVRVCLQDLRTGYEPAVHCRWEPLPLRRRDGAVRRVHDGHRHVFGEKHQGDRWQRRCGRPFLQRGERLRKRLRILLLRTDTIRREHPDMVGRIHHRIRFV